MPQLFVTGGGTTTMDVNRVRGMMGGFTGTGGTMMGGSTTGSTGGSGSLM